MTKLYKEKEDIYSKSTEKANIFVLLETNDIDAFIYYPKVGNYKNSNKTFSKIEFGTGGDIFSIYYSYNEAIGYYYYREGDSAMFGLSKNEWGNTTGRHINLFKSLYNFDEKEAVSSYKMKIDLLFALEEYLDDWNGCTK